MTINEYQEPLSPMEGAPGDYDDFAPPKLAASGRPVTPPMSTVTVPLAAWTRDNGAYVAIDAAVRAEFDDDLAARRVWVETLAVRLCHFDYEESDIPLTTSLLHLELWQAVDLRDALGQAISELSARGMRPYEPDTSESTQMPTP